METVERTTLAAGCFGCGKDIYEPSKIVSLGGKATVLAHAHCKRRALRKAGTAWLRLR